MVLRPVTWPPEKYRKNMKQSSDSVSLPGNVRSPETKTFPGQLDISTFLPHLRLLLLTADISAFPFWALPKHRFVIFPLIFPLLSFAHTHVSILPNYFHSGKVKWSCVPFVLQVLELVKSPSSGKKSSLGNLPTDRIPRSDLYKWEGKNLRSKGPLGKPPLLSQVFRICFYLKR